MVWSDLIWSGHKFSENIWFGLGHVIKDEKARCHPCDGRTDRHWKVGQYSAEAESAIELWSTDIETKAS